MIRTCCVRNNVVAISVDYRRYARQARDQRSLVDDSERLNIRILLPLKMPWTPTIGYRHHVCSA